jgi:hypothetical protein
MSVSGATTTSFTVQLVECCAHPIEHGMALWRETVHAWTFRALWFRRAQPAMAGHSRQHRVQRTGTQAVAVAVQLLQHPLAIHALLGGVMKDVDLPEGEEEFTDNRVLHEPGDHSTGDPSSTYGLLRPQNDVGRQADRVEVVHHVFGGWFVGVFRLKLDLHVP